MATVDDLAAYVGRAITDPDDVTHAQRVLDVTTALVRSYTRGRGFVDGTPGDDLDAVIVAVAARTLDNPGSATYEQLGAYAVRHPDLVFTLTDQAVLHRHRQRIA